MSNKVICESAGQCNNKVCMHSKLHIFNTTRNCNCPCPSAILSGCIPPKRKLNNKFEKLLKKAESVVTDIKKILGR